MTIVPLLHASIDAHDAQPPEWRRAEVLASYGLLVTAEELTTLTTAVDALLRPFIGSTREAAPTGADPVHVVFDAVRRPRARGVR